jgi:alpha 1,2-mannosyltransferase
MLKPLSILYSKFKEVLFLDADNICIKDPSFLFETKPYIETGAIFWPDFWKTAKDNPIWEIIENKEYSTPEQESGQILINKEICWKELNLCVFFNEKYEIYHRLLWGDKDTFRFAWFALKTKFHMIEKPVGSCGFMLSGQTFSGNTMVQHCVNSEILFLHRNLLKWDITRLGEMTWLMIKEFKTSAKKKVIYCNAHSLNLGGDVIEYQVPSSIKQTEINCLNYLHDLRESKFYIDFFIECYIIAESK